MTKLTEKNFIGGLLLTGMLLMFLFSFMLTMIITEFKETQQFTAATIDYYKARIMVLLLLKNLSQSTASIPLEGQQAYTDGQLSFNIQEDQVAISVTVGTHVYHFKEEIQRQE